MDSLSDPADPGLDPIDLLVGEHRTIRAVLNDVERETRRLEHGGPLREGFWRDLLRFCDEFDTGVHHQKEEHLLFPAIEAAGLGTPHGPTAVLRDEHLRSQFWRQRIGEALRLRDRTRLCAAASVYVDLTRGHLQKEDQLLFPLARRLLVPAELDRLRVAFAPLLAELGLRRWLQQDYVPVAGSAAGDGAGDVA